MNSREVLNILKVSRPTLKKYVDEGKIKATILSSGYWDYDRDSVFEFIGQSNNRKNVIYARSYDWDNEQSRLNKRIEQTQSWCNEQGIKIDEVYKDVAHSINLSRKGLANLTKAVYNNEIDTIYVLSRGMIGEFAFDFVQNLFAQHKTKIVCINPQSIDSEVYKEAKDFIDSLKDKISEKNLKKLQEKADIL